MARKLAGKSICMLGCDLREVDLACALVKLGVDLHLVGFPSEGELKKALHFTDPKQAVQGVDGVIAPMANTDLSGQIFVRLDDREEKINLAETIPLLKKRTPLLIGVAKPIIKGLVTQYGLRLLELAEDDQIAVLNSIPTAEGALQVAMENTLRTIHGSKVLVLGLGRCGTTLVHDLVALGAEVTVASRSLGDLARAIAMHAQALPLVDLQTRPNFQIIFNTIPAMVLPRSYLRLLQQNTVIIDIAASPGGVDFLAADQLGLKVIHALSLPGKVAPLTAGEILCETVPHLLEKLLEEDNHGS